LRMETNVTLKNKMHKIFIIIPPFNEEKNLPAVLDELKKYDYQIVVVDDGSTDRTFEIIQSKDVKALRHKINRGQGAALQTGAEYALSKGSEVVVHFAGYDRYVGQRLVDYYCLLPKWVRRNIVKRITDRIPESFGYKSLAQKAAWVNEMSLFTGGERYAQSMGILRFTHEAKQKLFTSTAQDQIADKDSAARILKYFEADNVDHVVDRMLYTDLMTRIPDHILTIADRMTMAHSLESRAPLIDYRVVEFAASIPAGIKLKGNRLKYILRQVAARYMPEELIGMKKQGFRFPLGIWFRTELKDFLRRLFAQSRFVELGLFEPAYIEQLLDEHIAGKVDHNYRIWVLLNLEFWYRMYFDGMTVDDMREFTDSLA